MRKAVYPGSFDPLTLGHLDIIKRASKLFDEVTVAVLINERKQSLFTIEERLDMIKEATEHLHNVKVDSFSGLLAEYCKEDGIISIVRGLRAVSDYEYELQMAHMNHSLNSSVDTIFLATEPKYSFISSSLVKEVMRFGGDTLQFLPVCVSEKLKNKFAKENGDGST
ncbi:MAG: pantetheine-phosphate adenylyltransferase [Filifactoraceae bacterium]